MCLHKIHSLVMCTVVKETFYILWLQTVTYDDLDLQSGL